MKIDKQRGKMKTIMKSKPLMLLIAFGFVFVLSSGIYAAYILSHQSNATLNVVGGISSFQIIADISDISLSVNSSLVDLQTIELQNDNGLISLNYNLTTTITNQDPTNCNSDGDLTFELEHEGVVVTDGSNFTMNPGVNNFNFTTTAISDRACPQNGTIQIDFFE